jgi:hypothetical protein
MTALLIRRPDFTDKDAGATGMEFSTGFGMNLENWVMRTSLPTSSPCNRAAVRDQLSSF